MNTPQELAAMTADQARAEQGAQAWADYYEGHPGVPIGTTGSDPQPVPVTGPAAVTGCPWDQQ